MKLILGTAQLCRSYGIGNRVPAPNSINQAVDFLLKAQKLGFDAIDTASVYGDAEKAIGISGVKLEVHTKLDPRLEVLESIEKSLKLLNRDHLDLTYIHDSQVILYPDDKTLSTLVTQIGGTVKRIGISVYSMSEYLAAVADPRIDVIQVPYNVFDQRFRLTSPMTENSHNPDVFIRSVLLQGLLLLNPMNYPVKLRNLVPNGLAFLEVLGRYNVSPLEAIIGFARNNKKFTGLIVGINSMNDLTEIMEIYGSVELDPTFIKELEGLAVEDNSLTDPRNWD